MGDFLVDFRAPAERRLPQAAAALRFMDHVRAEVIDEPAFGLAVTFTGDASIDRILGEGFLIIGWVAMWKPLNRPWEGGVYPANPCRPMSWSSPYRVPTCLPRRKSGCARLASKSPPATVRAGSCSQRVSKL